MHQRDTAMSMTMTKALDIIEQINECDADRHWSGTTSAMFMAEAYKLRHADPGAGDMVLGMIHCFDGDIQSMRKAFKNAVALYANKNTARMNYANALYRHGFFSEAIALMLDVEKTDKSPEIYEWLAELCVYMGLMGKARHYFERAKTPKEKQKMLLQGTGNFGFAQQRTLECVQQSLHEDAPVWASLATR